MDDSLGAIERTGPGAGVADVAADHLDAGLLLLGGDVLLAVQQGVEHTHLTAVLEQLVGEQGADVAAAAGDQGLAHVCFLSSRFGVLAAAGSARAGPRATAELGFAMV